MPRAFSDPVHVAGLDFNVGKDADGVTWYCDTLIGWEDSVKPTIESARMGYSDGVAVGERAPLDARFVEFGGAIVAPNRTQADLAWRRMQSALDEDLMLDIVRMGPIAEKMEVKRADKLYRTQDIGHAFRFATTLMAPWPFKEGIYPKGDTAGVFVGGEFYRRYPRYAPLNYIPDPSNATPTVPTTISILNAGNANAYPLVEITGFLPANAWYLQVDSTQQSLSFAIDIGATNVLRIDNRRQIATLDGQVVDYWKRGDWLHLPKERNSTLRMVATDAFTEARFRVTAADTWK